ncbi:MAG: DNA polymerase III subunit gamma/tau [Candidatus Rhabdochlamydia sp.]
MHQNLSRQYRPQTFETIVGQSSIVTTLKNAIRLQKIAPAYIFCGSRGTGKTTLARLFAKALNCTAPLSSIEPCNACSCCLEISQGKSLAVIEIDGASNRGIDDMRKINETVAYSVLNGHYKVYIIDEVHMLTKEAFNALLKTLEEPPANVKFLFATTEPQKVLPTIMSRCQRFDLKRLSVQEIIGKLKLIATNLMLTVEEEAFELIAHWAEGGLRDAESIFDQIICFEPGPISYQTVVNFLGIPSRKLYFDLDQAVQSQSLSSAFLIANQLFSSGKEMTDFLEGLLGHFRLHLLTLLKLPLDTFLHPEEKKHYQALSSFYTQDHLLYLVNYLMGFLKEMGKITLRRVTMEMILLHIVQSHSRLSLPSLVRRLEELAHQQSSDPAPSHIQEKGDYQEMVPLPEELPVQDVVSLLTPPPQQHSSVPTSSPVQEERAHQETLSSQEELTGQEVISSLPSDEDASSAVIPLLKSTSEISPPAPIPIQEEIILPPPAPPVQIPEEILQESKKTSLRFHQSKYDTILRFAAVELEGILKKD